VERFQFLDYFRERDNWERKLPRVVCDLLYAVELALAVQTRDVEKLRHRTDVAVYPELVGGWDR
jgi:hypothetical protein